MIVRTDAMGMIVMRYTVKRIWMILMIIAVVHCCAIVSLTSLQNFVMNAKNQEDGEIVPSSQW